jgi:hypothetical protein
MSLVCNYCGSDDIQEYKNESGEEWFCNSCQDYCEPKLEADYFNDKKLGDCCG